MKRIISLLIITFAASLFISGCSTMPTSPRAADETIFNISQKVGNISIWPFFDSIVYISLYIEDDGTKEDAQNALDNMFSLVDQLEESLQSIKDEISLYHEASK